jgi:site-specific DNA-cytosine methylase/integrase
MWHPVHGEIRRYGVYKHPPNVIAAFRKAAAGKSRAGEAIVSSVLERQNKAMAEWQFRGLLAGRPCIVLEDNQGSVNCINSGYANNVHMQAMQMASNLRQAVDEAPMEAYYCQTENMSIYDKSSRLDFRFIKRMNVRLAALGMPQWEEVEVSEDVKQLSQWLDASWQSQFPMLQDLLTKLGNVAAIPGMSPVSLDVEQLQQPVDDAWQKRVVAAAMPIPDSLGSFGPMAYSVEHVHCELPTVAGCELTWQQLRRRNDRLAQSSGYSMFDAFHGGCGGSTAAILAGIFVKAGAELAPAEIDQFEQLTGRTSLGDVRSLLAERIPNVNIWFSCSNCQDFCPLGSKKGTKGGKGGDLFTQQFLGAKAANAQVVIIENVDGVATLHDGAALRTLQQEAAKCGYSRFYSKRVVFSEHGDPEHRARRVIVAFQDSVQLDKPWQFPFATGESTCAGEFLEPSYKVPSRFWDKRSWYRAATTWARRAVDRIFTLGYKYGKDKLGNPAYPARVWHPAGLFPTVLASGNAGLLRWPKLRAMCPLRGAFNTWAHLPHAAADPTGCIRERRPMPSECLSAKGFPSDTPFSSDSDGFRFAGNAVPPTYFKKLFLAVTDVLDRAEVPLVLPRKPDEYITYAKHPLHPNDVDITVSNKTAGKPAKKGQNVCHRLNRDKLTNVPVTAEELKLMSDQLVGFSGARLAEGSKKEADMGWAHWLSFCSRFHKPIFLNSETQSERAAAAAQAQLFLCYETACFDQKATSAAQKLWAVGVHHKAALRADPFVGNALVKTMLADACALDEPSKQKIPVTNTTLAALRDKLDLQTRPGFTFWTGIRFAIAFLCRISEWAFDDLYTVKWKHILFWTSEHSPGGRRRIRLTSADQLSQIAELQVIFFSDKTARPGESKARSFWAIKDQSDSRCIARDMARLWLISERNSEYDVFSWNSNTAGVKRDLVNKALKQAAIDTGIPGADVSSHSLRATGLSRLLSAKPDSGNGPTGMQWEQAKKFGRWKSDCALRYFWASNELAREYAASIWDSSCFVRCRGNGDLQMATDRMSCGN